MEEANEKGHLVPKPLIVFAIVVVLSVTFISVLGNPNSSNDGSQGPPTTGEFITYKSEKYKFSFDYPQDWVVENTIYHDEINIKVKENSSRGFYAQAWAIFSAGSLDLISPETLEEGIENFADAENFSLVAGPKDVKIGPAQAKDFTVLTEYMGDEFRVRQRWFRWENKDYKTSYVAKENFYDNYDDTLENIFKSFSLKVK